MHDVAIVGAGEIGGALAHILARLDVLGTIRLIDERGSVAEGQALDIMIPSSSVGQAIANYVRANAKALGVSEVIWAQHIWTVQRASEGWRLMPDRGSTTANHYDHVHVTVYGNSGTA